MPLRPRFLSLVAVVALITISGLEFAAGNSPTTVASLPAGANLAAVAASSFQGTFAYLIAGGYVLMFIAMVFEGPMITAAATFAATLGYFNIFAVFALAILGDLVADIGYYAAGYIGRVAFVERYGHRFGLSQARMQRLERLLHTHPSKTITVIKLIPGIAPPGLMMVGAVRLPPAKFATIALLIILPKVLLFMFLGYYFGHAYDAISGYVQNAEYFIIIAVAFTVVAYYGYTKLTGLFAYRLETI